MGAVAAMEEEVGMAEVVAVEAAFLPVGAGDAIGS